ncbi:MAG: AI-2E family transporter [Terriglobia bacterium]
MERTNVWLWFLFALLLYLTYRIFAPFLVPLAWAGVLTICFYPVHRRIRARLRRPNWAALATVLLLTGIIILPAMLVMGHFAAEAVEAVGVFRQQLQEEQLPALEWLRQHLPLERLWSWLATQTRLEQAELQALAMKQVERLAGFLAGQAGVLARNLVFFVLQLLVTLFTTFYLFRDGARALERVRGLLPLKPAQRDRLLQTAQDVLHASVYSSFLIAAIQGMLGGLLFWALGIRSPVFWGVVMALFSLLPVIGAWIVWLPAALLFLLEGDWKRALILVAVGAVVIGTVDNVLRPWLISGRICLNGLLVFISVLGGLAAFGPIGLLLGPMIVAVGVAILDAYTAPEALPAEPATQPANPR